MGARACGLAFAAAMAVAQPAQADPALPAPAPAPSDGLHLSGSMRLRYEVIDGQSRAGFDASDDLASLHTDLKLEWRHRAISLVADLQDSRAWGAGPGTPLATSEVNTFEPVQAYIRADLGSALGRGTDTTVQAGRFVMALGSKRLIANDEYRNATNGFTGVRGDLSAPGGYKATLFYVLPQIRLPDDLASLLANRQSIDWESFDTTMWGAFVSRQRPGRPLLAEASFVRFAEHDSPGHPTRDRSLNNFGLRLVRDPRRGEVDWGAEGIYQWGSISASLDPAAATLPVSASFVRVQVGYTFPGRWKPHLLFEFDRASGDGTGPGYGRFDSLFGMRRADLAPASLYGLLIRSNLMSPGVRLEVAPGNRFDGYIGYRALYLANSRDSFSNSGIVDPSGRSGSFAGHQFDLRLRYWLKPNHLRAEFDGVYLAKGRFLTEAPHAPISADTRYASLNLTAAF